MTESQAVVLLTGGTGFLGSYILKMLLENGHGVVLLKRKDSNLSRINELLKNTRLKLFDVENGLAACFRDNKIDFILHTATCYGRDDERSAEIIKTNLSLPLELLEFGRRHGCQGFINADTFFNEQLGLKPKERIYVKTKKYFVHLAQEIVPAAGFKFVNLIIEHMYGPNDSAKKFVPFIVGEILKNSEVPLTRGEQKRDFIFVEDVARAFVLVLNNFDRLGRWEEFGVGTGLSVTIKDFVERIKDRSKSEAKLKWGALPYRENEIMDSFADVSANQKIGWKAEISLEDGIDKTLSFYKILAQ